MSPEWFQSWFDSPYYQVLYAHRDHAEADAFIQKITGVLGLSKGARILDLACGQGRHAKALASLGYEVTGADLSEQSINAAKKMENDRLNFVVHDMRRPIAISYYDAVLNLFTSFGYFCSIRDNVRTVDAIRACLKENGYLVIDYFNSDCVRSAVNAQPKGESTINGIHFSWEKSIDDNKVIKAIHVIDNGKTHDFSEAVSLFSLEDFSGMLHGKFDIIKTFGDYNLGAFDVKSSPRLIIVCRKSKSEL